MTKVVILQSNYIPWRGYFDLIRSADIFIYYDEVQYTRGDWRNRNKIVAANGERWLTLPVAKADNFGQSIADTQISDTRWASKHWDSLKGAYKGAPQFQTWKRFFEMLYKELDDKTSLSKINKRFIEAINAELSISTKMICSSEIDAPGDQTGRLINLCQSVGAAEYISGQAAKNYLDRDKFADADINLQWFTYPTYKEYRQMDGSYRAGVSIVDTLFNTAENVFERAP